MEQSRSDRDPTYAVKLQILQQSARLVPFDGWSESCFVESARQAGVESDEAYAAFPNGVNDLAVFFHHYGDNKMLEKLHDSDLEGLRYSEKIAHAVWLRVAVAKGDRNLVRRGIAYFSLPPNVTLGSSLIWGTANKIWNFMGDSSDDYNWYTKRMILSGVLTSTLVYFTGDDSDDNVATREFIDRQIASVLNFEKYKSRARNNPLVAPILNSMEKYIKKPRAEQTDVSLRAGH